MYGLDYNKIRLSIMASASCQQASRVPTHFELQVDSRWLEFKQVLVRAV
jgi:hypothetical protein